MRLFVERWKTQAGDEKNLKKLEKRIFFQTRNVILEDEIWTNIFCWKSNFCGEFSARFRKFKIFVEKKGFHTQKKRKTMKDFCLRHRTTEIQKMSSWRDETSGFSAKRKINLSCSKEHDWKKKVRNNKGDKTKTHLQKGMNKWKKVFFFF